MQADDLALRDAILADPDNDGPRLIYADWLDERGDPRGEFIRLQCAEYRLPRNDVRRVELLQLARRLLHAYEATWMQPIHAALNGRGGLFQQVAAWFGRDASSILLHHEFRRGFVETMYLPVSEYLQHGTQLHAIEPLIDLRLEFSRSESSLENWTELAKAEGLSQVRSLKLGAMHLVHGGLEALFQSPHLANLRELRVISPDSESSSVRALIDSPLVRQLEHLQFSGAGRMGGHGALLLGNAKSWPKLKSLHLNNLGLNAEDVVDLVQLPLFGQLHDFSLAQNSLGNAMMPALLERVSPELDRLDLSNVEMGDNGAELLAASPILRRLQRLKLEHNRITDRGARALADSPHLVGDTQVTIHDNFVSDDMLRVMQVRLGDRLRRE